MTDSAFRRLMGLFGPLACRAPLAGRTKASGLPALALSATLASGMLTGGMVSLGSIVTLGGCASSPEDASATEGSTPSTDDDAGEQPSEGAAPVADGDSEAPAGEGAVADATEMGAQENAAGVSRQGATGQEPASEFERTRLLAQLVQQGDFYTQAGQYEQALDFYSRALQLAPNDARVNGKVLEIHKLIGDRTATAIRSIQDEVQREVLSRALSRASALRAIERGGEARTVKDYDGALEAYEQALTLVKVNTLIQDETLSEMAVMSLIAATKGERDQYLREQMEARENEAERLSESERRAQTQRQAAEVSRWMHEARIAFQNGDFEQALRALDRVLHRRPDLDEAVTLRDMVEDARREKSETEIRDRFRYEWIKTMQEIEHSDLPQNQVIMHEDREHWREVSARTPLRLGEDAIARDPRDLEIERALGEKVLIPAEIADAELMADVLKTISKRIGVNVQLLLEAGAEEEGVASAKNHLGLVGGTMTMSEWLRNLPLTPSAMTHRVRNGVVQVLPRSLALKDTMVRRFYEVSEIVRKVAFYPTKEINLYRPGAEDFATEEEPPEEALIASAETLPDLIKANIARGDASWDAGAIVEVTPSGTLVVMHTPEVHAQIEELLAALQGATRVMVDVQSRFMSVADNFLEDIGVDLRGLGDQSGGEGEPGKGTALFFDDFGDAPGSPLEPGRIGTDNTAGIYYSRGSDGDILGRTENLYDRALGNESILTNSGGLSAQYTFLDDTQIEAVLRAVSKSERLQLITAPRLLVYNTERANISVTNQVSYVSDFDVEIAQAASIADPVIQVISDGVVLDVTPIVSADRRFITMELRPTVATLTRPIREVTTTLGVGSPVTIQLPELEIQRVRTTVTMPDGATLLLGGQNISEKQDFTSGIPVLSDIPVISFFFSRKGRYTSNRRLLILLKAEIVILEEHEPELFQ
ncbi:MAG: tetratricopeptide repeat protein [Planctomycetes bacterium]|nr:tetratricopeptide repeat protein [Planctomycetota bacterium]